MMNGTIKQHRVVREHRRFPSGSFRLADKKTFVFLMALGIVFTISVYKITEQARTITELRAALSMSQAKCERQTAQLQVLPRDLMPDQSNPGESAGSLDAAAADAVSQHESGLIILQGGQSYDNPEDIQNDTVDTQQAAVVAIDTLEENQTANLQILDGAPASLNNQTGSGAFPVYVASQPDEGGLPAAQPGEGGLPAAQPDEGGLSAPEASQPTAAVVNPVAEAGGADPQFKIFNPGAGPASVVVIPKPDNVSGDANAVPSGDVVPPAPPSASGTMSSPVATGDGACREIAPGELRYALPHLNITALATFPGSGNTWTRHLIQQLSGYNTGSVYDDLDLKRNGFPGEFKMDGSVIVVKTHLTGAEHRSNRKFAKAVIVIRNPWDALVAEFNRQAHGHTGFAAEDKFHSLGWQTYLSSDLPKWIAFYNDWLTFPGPKLILFYEELKSDLKTSLRQLCEFLDIESTCTEERLNCVVNNSEGNFKRKAGKAIDNTVYFTREQLIRLEQDKDVLSGKLTDCVRENTCSRYYSVWPTGLL